MAGKINSRKSKAKLHDAITLNGESQETSDIAASTQDIPSDMKENVKTENTDASEASSSEETCSSTVSKGIKRKASELSDENLDTNIQSSPQENKENTTEAESLNDSSSTDAQTRKSGRKVRRKKPKTAYDDSPIHKSEAELIVKEEIKDEPMDEEIITSTPDTNNLSQMDSSDRPSSQMSTKSDGGASVDSPMLGKNKVKLDLSNPLFREPMALGWKRELVFRATLDNKNRRQGDIYYYTPTGKKLRSTREISDYLTDGLTLENFTFAKESIGLNDPSKEIIRDARNIKSRSSTGGLDSPVTPTVSASSTTPTVLGKRTPKPKLPKGASPPPASPASSVPPAVDTPVKASPKKSPKTSFKVKLTGSRLSTGSPKTLGMKSNKNQDKKPSLTEKPQKTPGDNKTDKKKKSLGTTGKKTSLKNSSNARDSIDISTGEPIVQQTLNSVKEQCSIQCLKAMGMIPTLQCQLCLCLYHYECVGINHDFSASNYNCLKCRDKPTEVEVLINDPSTSANILPPLTPITSMKSHIPNSVSPPRLQRIPRPIEKSLIPKFIVDNKNTVKDTSVSLNVINKSTDENVTGDNNGQVNNAKGLVGSMTTWFPPSSSIQMSKPSPETNPATTSPATSQGIALFAGRKYIVVPKHNVLNVIPAQTSMDNNDIKHSEKALGGISITTVSSSNLSPSSKKNIKAKTMNDTNIVPDTEISPVSFPIPSNLTNDNGSTVADNDFLDPNNAVDENTIKKKVPHETASALNDALDTKSNSTNTSNSTSQKTANNSTASSKEKQKSENNTDKQIATATTAPFVQHFCLNVSAGYFALLKIFQYLKVQELLRASRVCRLWNEMSNSPSLWRTVRMKNSQVGDWKGFAKSLQKHQTKNLDLRKMLIPAAVDPDDMWKQFSENIGLAESLVSIDFCRCPASIIEKLCESNPNMQVINALTIRDDKLNLLPFSTLNNLRELRLKSSGGFEIQKDLSSLRELKNLRHLSITSVKELVNYGCEVIAELVELQSLELGECNEFPEDFGTNILNKLQKLERLRLEKGQGNCYTFKILECVSKLPLITQLELVNFDIKAGFDKSLALCTNIRRMLIIPTYITQSATTNHMVLSGVIKLSSSLTHFVWGVTLELLRVTELFVDQYENSKLKDKKPLTESIPVLKPVPSLAKQDDKSESTLTGNEAPQVEILTLQALQKLLNGSLPQTRVRILKIPFHATWRQSISDTQ